MTAAQLIEKLRLKQHPEGGWFRRTYESAETLRLDRGERYAATAIYYLLARGEHSALHRLLSDETWFFHAGCGLVVHLFGESGYEEKRLGPVLSKGENPQLVISAGTTFGAELATANEWCLIGCSVCPGFEMQDFSWGHSDELLERFPDKFDVIDRLKPRPLS